MKRQLFLVLISLLTCQLFAQPTSRKVESIQYSLQNNNLMALITLSDGTSWRWTPDVYSETLLQDWEKGDEVVMKPISHPGLSLYNLTHPRFAPIVAISRSSLQILPRIIAIEEHSLILDNHTSWKPVYFSQLPFLKYWCIGDRILITKTPAMDQYLINMSLPYDSRRVDMRTLAVAPCLPAIEED